MTKAFLVLIGAALSLPGVGAPESAVLGVAESTMGGAPESTPASSTVEPWVEREVAAMGTSLRIRVRAADRGTGLAAIEAAVDAVSVLEAVLSSWRPDSEVGRVNATPTGLPFEVSEQLGGLLTQIIPWIHETNGAFDPRVGALVDAWDLRGEGRDPSEAEIVRALHDSGGEAIRFENGARQIRRLRSAAWIDSGGFGKGAALTAAAGALEDAGIRDAVLDFGGQLMLLGDEERVGAGWTVAVAHPRHRGRPVARLTGRGVSVATSGGSERHVELEGRTATHVIDPRTGVPVTPWGSVSVVASDPLVADVVSTALFVMGPEEGWAWAKDREDVGVLFLVREEEDVAARPNRAMREWMPATAGDPIQAMRGEKPQEISNDW